MKHPIRSALVGVAILVAALVGGGVVAQPASASCYPDGSNCVADLVNYYLCVATHPLNPGGCSIR